MPTLVLNVPSWRAKQEKARSFEATLVSGVGDGYAIASTLVARVTPGCTVALLDKDRQLRAEGKLIKLVPNTKAANGIQRYDVFMEKLLNVPYKPERLNRNGVAVID